MTCPFYSAEKKLCPVSPVKKFFSLCPETRSSLLWAEVSLGSLLAEDVMLLVCECSRCAFSSSFIPAWLHPLTPLPVSCALCAISGASLRQTSYSCLMHILLPSPLEKPVWRVEQNRLIGWWHTIRRHTYLLAHPMYGIFYLQDAWPLLKVGNFFFFSPLVNEVARSFNAIWIKSQTWANFSIVVPLERCQWR